MSKTILACAAHPDDEVLGCGGTLARHAQEGDVVHILLVADGEGSRTKADDPTAAGRIDVRRQNAEAAARELGALPPRLLGLADQRLDASPLLDIIQAIETVCRDIRPAIVYTHHCGDLNLDHRRVAEAVMVALRPLPGSTVEAIYGFEVPSSTEWAPPGLLSAFAPSRFVSIAGTMEKKRAALRCYDAEMRDHPHPRSYRNIEALAAVRGAAAGLEAAEAFTVLRSIVR